MNSASKKQMLRLVLDLGPLLVFFAAFKYTNIYMATGIFMTAVLVALGVGYWLERKISPMPAFTAVLVLVLGGLTIYLQNDAFIKMKPTVLYAFFGVLLLGGLFVNRLFIKYVFGQAFDLTEQGWRKLTVRWGLFAFFLAIANEVVWRHFSTDIWVDYKVWGTYPLVFLFAMAQMPLILKHGVETKKD